MNMHTGEPVERGPERAAMAQADMQARHVIRTGRVMVMQYAEEHQRRADALFALARSIPENFPMNASEGLIVLVDAARR